MGSFDDLIPTEQGTGFADLVPTAAPDFASTAQSTVGGNVNDEINQSLVFQERRNRTGIDDTKGVNIPSFRAGFSRMDTDEERAAYLNDIVGNGNWEIDNTGEYIIQPAGLAKVGIQDDFARPIDEKDFTVSDLADFAGEAPAIAGSIGGSMAATGFGLGPGVAAAAGGAILGKLVDEAVETFEGRQLQGPLEISSDAAKEGLLAAGGEGIVRTGAAIGRGLLAPFAGRVTPEAARIAEQATEEGVSLLPGQVTGSPLVRRAEGLLQNLFGSEAQVQNTKAISKIANRMASGSGATRELAGKALVTDIKESRRALSEWADTQYAKIDELAGGQPIVLTNRLKVAAKQAKDDLPREADGSVLSTFRQEANSLDALLQLDETITPSQMSKLTASFERSADPQNIAPSVDAGTAKFLLKAANASYDDAGGAGGNEAARVLLQETRKEYAGRIEVFNDALVKRLTRDPSVASHVEPSKVIDVILKSEQPALAARIMKFAKPETKLAIEKAAADKILKSFVKLGDGPTDNFFDGKALRKAIDSFGEPTLNAVLGKETTANLVKLSDITRIASVTQGGSGGLVAAGIAMQPIAKFPILARLRLLNKLMRTKPMLKWLTVGMKAPKTRAGAKALNRVATFLTVLSKSDRATEIPQQEIQ